MRFTPDECENGVDGCHATELAELLTRLADEIGVLRQAVDELREELAYELRKLRDGVAQSPPPFHLTSMPRDPCAEDFHQRVNAVELTDFDPRQETLQGFVARLTADAAVERLAADAWYEDQEFPPGRVIDVEPTIYDWFAEYPVTVQQGADWFLVDDGLGNFFLLWHRSEKCFLRLLTDEQQQAFSRLSGIVPDLDVGDPDADTAPRPAGELPPPTQQQQTLW